MAFGKKVVFKFVDPEKIYNSVEEFNKEDEGKQPVAILVSGDSYAEIVDLTMAVIEAHSHRSIGTIIVAGGYGSVGQMSEVHSTISLVDILQPFILKYRKELLAEASAFAEIKACFEVKNKFTESEKTIKKLTKIRPKFNSNLPKKFIKRGGKVNTI